ncbi:hypothetical protein RvY_12208 [Ramazzottius varieornatus]|uniref:Uncharacterized protein n=1 Tax=Ramazzottius varieornatus TaxID=947166 RepID=A0A1D1VRC3_RAMVA|nr:hypothetical protein RvY_12208 [Ramazzottius varieornatus]
MDFAAPELEFARKLAANDKLQRDRAMRNLWRWLRSQSSKGKKFTQKELLLVWKGLYYCMWMSDTPLAQEDLTENIVKLADCFESQPSSLLSFFDAFFQTTAKEYSRLDRFRLDKYLMLTRRMLRRILRTLDSKGWKKQTVRKYFERFQHHVFSGDETKCPEGLQNFCNEIFLDELTKVLSPEEEEEQETNGRNKVDLTVMWIVFCDSVLLTKSPFLRNSITKNLFEELLRHEEVRGAVDLKEISSYAFEKGKDENCPVRHRKALYHIYSLFKSSLGRITSQTLKSSSTVEETNDKEMKNVE